MLDLVQNARQGMSFEPVKKMICGQKCQVFSRVCGFITPVENWNRGKKEEFNDRKKFKVPEVKK